MLQVLRASSHFAVIVMTRIGTISYSQQPAKVSRIPPRATCGLFFSRALPLLLSLQSDNLANGFIYLFF